MIHIVCCSDDNYAFNLAVIAESVLQFHAPEDVRFHFMHSNLSAATAARLDRYVAVKGISLSKYVINDAVFANLPEIGYFTIAMYYRLLIPELMPQGFDKVLYLDMDVIVEGCLDKLWQTNLSGKAAAVIEDGVPQHLGALSPKRYFNSGVMLINLDYWRTRNVKQLAINFMVQHRDLLRFPDQDALNVVLEHDVCYLHSRWNYHLNLDKKFLTRALRGKVSKEDAPVIVHFNQRVKPWMYNCKHPYRNRYWELLRKTTFSDYRMKNKTLASALFYYTPKPLRARLWPHLVSSLPQN